MNWKKNLYKKKYLYVLIFRYIKTGNVKKETNEDGVVKEYEYYEDNTIKSEEVYVKSEEIKDSKGNIIEKSRIEYEPNTESRIKGLVKKKINPNGSFTEYQYDKYGYGLMSIFWTQKVKLFYVALLASNSHWSGVM